MKDFKYEYEKLKPISSINKFRKDLWKPLNEYNPSGLSGIYETIHTVTESINLKVVKE
jgi:hypothetical protein